jgi:hypothetical protein
VLQEKTTKVVVNKLTTIITLKALNRKMELVQDIGMEIFDCGCGFRFPLQWKSPHIMTIIINKNKIILESSETHNGRGLKITVYYLERKISNSSGTRKWEENMAASLASITQTRV